MKYGIEFESCSWYKPPKRDERRTAQEVAGIAMYDWQDNGETTATIYPDEGEPFKVSIFSVLTDDGTPYIAASVDERGEVLEAVHYNVQEANRDLLGWV